MADSTFLARVAIENFKSIAACDVHLGPLTFMVGPNGAGKSNFLDALSFVKDGLTHSLDLAIRQRGGWNSLFHRRSRTGDELALYLELNLPSGLHATYVFRIRSVQASPIGWRYEITEEKCQVGSAFFQLRNSQVHSSAGIMPAPSPDRLFLVLASGQAPYREVFDALIDMQFYNFVPASIPDTDVFDFQQRLRSDGSNLTSVLNLLKYQNGNAHARIEGFLRVIMPTLKKISVEPVLADHNQVDSAHADVDPAGRKIALSFHQTIGDTLTHFAPTEMSSGTLRSLAVLTALYQAEPSHERRPTLTAIEDVADFIHPAELAVLYDALREASLTTQVIVTSHSPDLIDRKDVLPESILAVSAEDGLTRIGPLDQACRSALVEQGITAGELLRIGQITPAPAPFASVH